MREQWLSDAVGKQVEIQYLLPECTTTKGLLTKYDDMGVYLRRESNDHPQYVNTFIPWSAVMAAWWADGPAEQELPF